jgi:hypothetical protein
MRRDPLKRIAVGSNPLDRNRPEAQRLARHSTVTLTMNVYTALDVNDLRDAVGALKLS